MKLGIKTFVLHSNGKIYLFTEQSVFKLNKMFFYFLFLILNDGTSNDASTLSDWKCITINFKYGNVEIYITH